MQVDSVTKVRDSHSIGGIGGAMPAQPIDKFAGQPGQATGKRDDAAVSALRSIADVTSVIGLDESELSPAVRASLNILMQEVDRLRRELEGSRRRIEHLERLADEDTLVPLANRRAFVRELSRMVSFAERYGLTGSVLYFDVNNLKRLNDEHGHAAGDAALKKIAELLLANVRESDVVGRLGGDEFGVILAQADETAAREKAASLAALIAATPLEWEGKSIGLSVAYGLQPLAGAAGADDALNAADKAMYRHKHGNGTRDVPASVPGPDASAGEPPLRR
jgi:diguanylate cyclase (GGDEF)-like protein